MKITHKIYPNGFTIDQHYDDGSVSKVEQFDEYAKVIDKTKSIEENCMLMIDEFYISDYANKLYRKEITEADIPAEYLERVKAIVDERIKQDSEYSQAQYDAVIAELVMEGRL